MNSNRNQSQTRRKRRSFLEWYDTARHYYEEHGNLLVPARYVADNGMKLGQWICWMRSKYNGNLSTNGSIPANEIAMLESIGMVWQIHRQPTWEEWMEQVRIYVERHGNLLVPYQYTQNGYGLSQWLQNQRNKYRSGQLSAFKSRDLERYGMVWSLDHRRDWDTYCALAKMYYEEHGNLLVPVDYVTENGETLGRWIYLQRERHRKNALYPLDHIQTEILESIGMVWESVDDVRWEQMFDSVCVYLSECGRLPAQTSEAKAPDGRAMGPWISYQKRLIRAGKMDRKRKTRLRSIGIQ